MKNKLMFIVLMFVPGLLLGAAGEETATPPQDAVHSSGMPQGHPPVGAAHQHSQAGHPKTGKLPKVELGDDVKAKWKTVKLAVTAGDGKEKTMQANVGGKLALSNGALELNVLAYVPDFQTVGGVVSSASNDPRNPAVLVQLSEKGKVIDNGWVFQELPEFNTYRNAKLKLRLLAPPSS